MMLVLALAVASALVGPARAVGLAGLGWLAATTWLLSQQPEENLGHRAGFPGFAGLRQICQVPSPNMIIQAY
jgi:hypothetical protein